MQGIAQAEDATQRGSYGEGGGGGGGGTFSASIISTGEASGRLSLHVAKLGLFRAFVGSSKLRLPRSPTFVLPIV